MSKDFSVRLYEGGDEESIVDLLKLSFPYWVRIESPLEYWRWKYVEAPLGSEVVVAVSDGKIIGVVQAVLLHFKIGASILDCHYGDDATTHPDYRRMGVYGKINVLREKLRHENGIKLAYGFSTNPTVIKNQLKRGRLEFPHHLLSMIRVKNIDLHLKMKNIESSLYRSGFKALKLLNKVVYLPSTIKTKNDFSMENIKKFDSNINTFWNKVKDSYNFILEKSSRYLNWRYCDPRGGNYRVMQAVKDGEVLGFIVTELKRHGDYSDGYVTDLLALPDRMDVASVLLGDACRYFDGLGVNTVHYKVVKGNPYQLIASKYGFINVPLVSKEYFRWQRTGAEKEFELIKTSHPSQVHFNIGDCLLTI